MRLVVTKDYDTMSELSAAIVLEKMLQNKRVNLSLTAGNTPVGMYKILLEKLAKTSMDMSNIHYYNFDEVPFVGERYGMTMAALNEAFYDPAEISEENIHELNAGNYKTYGEKLLQDGGIDLIVMGVGADGHFCANMPGATSFDREIFSVDIPAGSDLFKMLKETSGKTPAANYVTFGPRTVLSSKHLLVFANGTSKAEIMKEVLEGPITEEIPASILRMHPNVTFILDEEAASLLEK